MNVALLILALALSVSIESYAGERSSDRIVSAGGSITEIMYELGLGENIIAVDTSSSFPPQVTALPDVGYFRSLAAEGLMSLNPQMLVAARGAGPAVVLDQIRALGVDVRLYDQSVYTLAGWKELISDVGKDFDKEHAAQELVERVASNISRSQETRAYRRAEINAITVLSIGQRGPVAAGRNTVPDLLMTLAGINNVAGNLDGYKPFSSELFAQERIDILLVPSHVVDGLGGEAAICENQIVKMATSNDCNLVVMDGLLLMGLGTRLDQAVSDIIDAANGV